MNQQTMEIYERIGKIEGSHYLLEYCGKILSACDLLMENAIDYYRKSELHEYDSFNEYMDDEEEIFTIRLDTFLPQVALDGAVSEELVTSLSGILWGRKETDHVTWDGKNIEIGIDPYYAPPILTVEQSKAMSGLINRINDVVEYIEREVKGQANSDEIVVDIKFMEELYFDQGDLNSSMITTAIQNLLKQNPGIQNVEYDKDSYCFHIQPVSPGPEMSKSNPTRPSI